MSPETSTTNDHTDRVENAELYSPLDQIPETDSKATNELWGVITGNISTMSTGGNKKVGRTRRDGTMARSTASGTSSSILRSTTASEAAESEITLGSTWTHSRTITPRSSRFAELVLNPRRIFVNYTNAIVPTPFVHFGTRKPEEGYKALPNLGSANIWIDMEDSNVSKLAAEYKEMRGYNLCETEFASLAMDFLLRREWRSSGTQEDRLWRADRMLELVSPPKESAHWRKPPILNDGMLDHVEWTWDVRPDCSYWLSLKGFSPVYRFQIQNCTFVRDWITCPYFSVEFKRDGESEDVAVARVTAAASLALFNRYRLHSEAKKAKPTVCSDSTTIRHYSLTFVGPKFVFWVLQPDIADGKWNGCTMKRLVGADASDEYGVGQLIDWINEIHRWGLSIHAGSCQRDIKAILNVGGVRTSDIHSTGLELDQSTGG
ncbi:hypothetical protein MAC_08232 [Metarhizium acridum CQMa 102]|uniref:Uncharacterized protein n=1 Tax=Metarhizium acridum (strain CQMa 102) TaxID=655827 RepID=E9EED4_METAQ|nr:uncharacterized protein MAC_08232 [Metarhizium acridum CQMa 102]XP_007816138.1 uncharacterized protein MAC_09798 [Metarhizium acridum CQMa 102]EFY84160.1 hypothetical protein MAC_09798 [Metarhizium acridum CQMa 102]EFY85762.1 hypothetical protein MAC_08232 [Metarhizium acridum CQMa 102]